MDVVQPEHPLEERIRRRVGGSLENRPLLERLETLRHNAWLLRGGDWRPPEDDGTLVRKVVGAPR